MYDISIYVFKSSLLISHILSNIKFKFHMKEVFLGGGLFWFAFGVVG